MNPFGDILTGLCGLLLMIPVFYLAGSLKPLEVKAFSRELDGIYTVGFGLILFMAYLTLIGSLGFLNPLSVSAFLVWPLARWRHVKDLGSWLRALHETLGRPRDGYELCCVTLMTFTAAAAAFFCFFPETGNDALCYQLNLPKLFAQNQSVMPLAYDANSYMPMAFNYLYTAALSLGSVSLAKLFHAFSGVLLALAVILLIIEKMNSKKIALTSALGFWLAPIVITQVSTTYVDLAVSFFLFLSVALFIQACEQPGSLKPFVLSGILAGVTIAVKFSLLVILLPFALAGFAGLIRSQTRNRLIPSALAFAAGCLIACGFWFVRNWILAGNPVFPYFGSLFGTIGFDNARNYLDYGVPKTLLNFSLMPATLTFQPEIFGRSNWIGPYFFISFPALILAWRMRTARGWLIFTFTLFTLWFFTSQVLRYLLPVLPLWTVASAMGFAALGQMPGWHSWGRRLRIPILGALALMSCFVFYHHRHEVGALVRGHDREAYLLEQERSFSAARWAQENLPPEAKILNAQEVRQFYFEHTLVREDSYHFFTAYRQAASDAAILERLKQEGFTHILVTRPLDREALPQPEDRRWLERTAQDPAALHLLRTLRSQNTRDERYEYRFYQIA